MLKHPFPAVVTGPTCCGKTQFLKLLLESGEDVFEGVFQNIIYCYAIFQPAYDEMQRTIPNITFIKGVPADLESMINPSIRNLVLIDDLMTELSSNPRITNLFTKGCHHRNLSVNCHYLILFKSPRDTSQVNHLARQIFPLNVKYMTESFEDATAPPYGYLLCDLKPETPNDFRLRTNIFPGETQYAYVKKI